MKRGRAAALSALGVVLLAVVAVLLGRGDDAAPVQSDVTTPPLEPAPLPVRTGLTDAAEGFAVSGEVRDTEGAPVEGAEVVWSGDLRDRSIGARTTTGADGAFVLQVANPGIVWVAEGAEPQQILVKAARTDLSFEQPALCPARLRVVDEQGAAVPGFQVSLKTTMRQERGAPVGVPLGDFAADRSGWIDLPRLLCSPVQVARRDPRQHPIVGGRLDPNLDRELELVVAPGARLRGRVETEDGEAVAATEVFIQAAEDRVTAQTDAEGSFEVQTPGGVEVQLGLMSTELGFPKLELQSPVSGDWETTWVVETPRVVMVECGSFMQCMELGYATCKPESDEPFGGGHCMPTMGSGLRCTCPEGDVRIEIAGHDSLRVPAGASSVDLDAPQEPVVKGEVVTVSLPVDHGGERDPRCSVEWKTATAREKVECGHTDTVELDLPPDEPIELRLWCHGRSQTRTFTVSADDSALPPMSTVGTAHLQFTLVSGSTGDEAVDAYVTVRGVEGPAAGAFLVVSPDSLAGGVARFADVPAGAWELTALREGEGAREVVELAPGERVERELTLRSIGR